MVCCHKSKFFLLGWEFDIYTDHRALVGLVNMEIREVDKLCLQKLRTKIMFFNSSVKFVPGKFHFMVDALSHKPRFCLMIDMEDIMADVYMVKKAYASSSHNYARDDPILKLIFEAAKEKSYQKVVEAFIRDQWLEDLPVDHPAREYKEVWDDLCIIDEGKDPLLVVDDARLVILMGARKSILRLLHMLDMGFRKTKETARLIYFWPRMTAHIQQLCDEYSACRETVIS